MLVNRIVALIAIAAYLVPFYMASSARIESMLKDDSAPGWVQAIGSLLVIVAMASQVFFERADRRNQAAEDRENKAKALGLPAYYDFLHVLESLRSARRAIDRFKKSKDGVPGGVLSAQDRSDITLKVPALINENRLDMYLLGTNAVNLVTMLLLLEELGREIARDSGLPPVDKWEHYLVAGEALCVLVLRELARRCGLTDQPY
jgi:hypothetical protein